MFATSVVEQLSDYPTDSTLRLQINEEVIFKSSLLFLCYFSSLCLMNSHCLSTTSNKDKLFDEMLSASNV